MTKKEKAMVSVILTEKTNERVEGVITWTPQSWMNFDLLLLLTFEAGQQCVVSKRNNVRGDQRLLSLKKFTIQRHKVI